MSCRRISIEDIVLLTKRLFNIDKLHDWQLKAIESILTGKDTLVITPTGSGKSIVYQIPSCFLDGLSIVISPLVSLIRDQIFSLKNKIPSAYISASQSPAERKKIIKNIQNYKLLYVTPERLESREFKNLFSNRKIKISIVVVDEAHCVSLWGNSFRPSYLRIRNFLKDLPEVNIAAFTASASPEVQNDIIKLLGMDNPAIFRQNFIRENLFISIKYVVDKFQYLLNNLNNNVPAIIYVSSKFVCNSLGYMLKHNGFSAGVYHADLKPEERELTQERFFKNEISIMVATSAFGMGINKKDIRYIVHYHPPIEIEEYYQEIGRAGRDGKDALCEMLVSFDDFKEINILFKENFPEWHFVKEIALKKEKTEFEIEKLKKWFVNLYQENLDRRNLGDLKKFYDKKKQIQYKKMMVVQKYITSSRCRKSFLQEYFGEPSAMCKSCDFCIYKENKPLLDEYKIKILSIIKRMKRVSFDYLRKIGIGLSFTDITHPGFSELRGEPLPFFIDQIYSLKNMGLIEFEVKKSEVLLKSGKLFY